MNWIISLFSLYECALHCSAMGVTGRQSDMWSPLCQKQWDRCGDGYELAIKNAISRESKAGGKARRDRERPMQRNVISPPVAEAMGLIPSLCTWPSWPVVDDSNNSPRTRGRLRSTMKLCVTVGSMSTFLWSLHFPKTMSNNGSTVRPNNCLQIVGSRLLFCQPLQWANRNFWHVESKMT